MKSAFTVQDLTDFQEYIAGTSRQKLPVFFTNIPQLSVGSHPSTSAVGGLNHDEFYYLFVMKRRISSKISLGNRQKSRWFIKIQEMSEGVPLLKHSTEYITSGNQNQKQCGRQYIPGECTGKWSDEEHMKYIAFIDFNKQIMKSKERRRSNKFYRGMADFIQTRNALQCRSHHQKLEAKYTHPIKIVSVFKHQFHQDAYKEIKQNLLHHKQNKQLEKQTKNTENELSHRTVQIQTKVIQYPFSQNQNSLLMKQSYLPFASTYSFYPNNSYLAYSNQIAAFSPQNSMFINAFYNWERPVFAYGFEFN